MTNNPESSKQKLSGRHPVVGYELSRRTNLLRLCEMIPLLSQQTPYQENGGRSNSMTIICCRLLCKLIAKHGLKSQGLGRADPLH